MAVEFPVVHFKIRHRATGLTPPAVAAQDLLAQPFVRQGIQPQGSGFRSFEVHAALRLMVLESRIAFDGRTTRVAQACRKHIELSNPRIATLKGCTGFGFNACEISSTVFPHDVHFLFGGRAPVLVEESELRDGKTGDMLEVTGIAGQHLVAE